MLLGNIEDPSHHDLEHYLPCLDIFTHLYATRTSPIQIVSYRFRVSSNAFGGQMSSFAGYLNPLILGLSTSVGNVRLQKGALSRPSLPSLSQLVVLSFVLAKPSRLLPSLEGVDSWVNNKTVNGRLMFKATCQDLDLGTFFQLHLLCSKSLYLL